MNNETNMNIDGEPQRTCRLQKQPHIKVESMRYSLTKSIHYLFPLAAKQCITREAFHEQR